MRAGEANRAIDEVLHDTGATLEDFTFPAPCLGQPKADVIVAKVLALCRERLASFA